MTDYEHLKLCAARYVWRIQNEKTPISKVTWLEWWEHKFKDNYKEYVSAEKRKKEKAEKV